MAFLCKPNKTTSSTSNPQWLDDATQKMLESVFSFYNTPYQDYTGQRVAGFNPDENQAFQGFRDLQNRPDVSAEAENMIRQGSGSAAGGIQQYLNPFMDAVSNPAIQKIQQAGTTAKQGIDAQAQMAGAFGDTGHALLERGANRDTQTAIGNAVGQINAQGFDTALGASQADQGRLIQGGQALVGTDAAAQNTALQKLTALLSGGQLQQNNAQAGLDAQFQQWGLKNADAYNRIQALISSITGAPHGSTTEQTSPNNSWAQILGSLAGSAFSGGMGGFGAGAGAGGGGGGSI